METKNIQMYDNFTSDENPETNLGQTEVTPDWVIEYLKSGKPFGIVSAFLHENNVEANMASHEALKEKTLRDKYGYKEFAFHYSSWQDGTIGKNTHRLLLIPEIPYHELLSLGEIFGQQSIAIRSNVGLDFIRVSDEQLLLSIPVSDVQLTVCNLLLPNKIWDSE